MLRLQDFQYTLPESLIAQSPAEPRDSSKLLVVNRADNTFQHQRFFDLPKFLRAGDVLVLNNSKTIPGRTTALRPSGKPMEIFFLHPFPISSQTLDNTEEWEVLSKPGLKIGQEVSIQNSNMRIHVLEDLGYTRRVRVSNFTDSVLKELDRCGSLPLPPYIQNTDTAPEQYQTTFAKMTGSAATPTAGLHFTPALLEKVRAMGVIIVELTLHVGLGTFLPVKTEDLEEHHMHSEWYELSEEAATIINKAKDDGRRVIAVGTTSVRTLESCVDPNHSSHVLPGTGDTDIFLYPPYRFRIVDALITNFHLPASTLLMLVSAFCAQQETFHNFHDSLAGQAYQEAIQHEYRFFSFGDAMLIA